MQTRRRSAQLQATNPPATRMQDEVYRQMFRLEESRPGADLGLTLALLRAWIAADGKSHDDEERDWLRKISPICLKLIEAAGAEAPTHGCPH